MKRALKLIAVNLFILVTLFILADLVIAFVRRSTGLEKVSARTIHPSFHHGFIPKSTFRHSWDKQEEIVETINKFGMRANATDADVKRLADYKTVVLGDSFAEGVGIRADSTLPSLLPEEYFPAANLGVISHSPTLSRERLNFYKRRGLTPRYIIHLIDPSDFQDEVHYSKIEGFQPISNDFIRNLAEKIGESFASSSYTWEALLTLAWLAHAENPIRSISLYSYWGGSDRYYQIRDPYKTQSKPQYFDNGELKVIERIKQISSEFRGDRYVAVVYKWPALNEKDFNSSNLREKDRFTRFKEKIIAAIGNRQTASVCDISSLRLAPSDYIKGDIHWNSSGYRKISSFIAKHCLA